MSQEDANTSEKWYGIGHTACLLTYPVDGRISRERCYFFSCYVAWQLHTISSNLLPTLPLLLSHVEGCLHAWCRDSCTVSTSHSTVGVPVGVGEVREEEVEIEWGGTGSDDQQQWTPISLGCPRKKYEELAKRSTSLLYSFKNMYDKNT